MLLLHKFEFDFCCRPTTALRCPVASCARARSPARLAIADSCACLPAAPLRSPRVGTESHSHSLLYRLFLARTHVLLCQAIGLLPAGSRCCAATARCVCVVVPLRATSGRAEHPYVCARGSWCFPTIPPPPLALLRPPPADSPVSSVQVRVEDPGLEFE